MSEKIHVTVDGRLIETENSVMLLEILNEYGIYVPQLCNHPSLTPNGACRLCMVEITKEEWVGKSKLVTSCLYPAENGLIVSTRSRDVLKTRRSLLELYLSQYPYSEAVRALARYEGIDSTPYPLKAEAELCVLCGLCTRVCQDFGPGAISTLSRGVQKRIGPNLEGIAEDCSGCRACTYLCPAGAIPMHQQDQLLTIWNRSFEIPVCSVQPELCRGCGICEEVCPDSIPRVAMFKNGITVSKISAAACVGCGICAGSCPAGAIKQKKTEALTGCDQLYESSLKDKTIAFICPRSPMPAAAEDMIRVSCIGSVEISTLLYCIAAGANGVALVCRDRLSCPYHHGGDLGEKRASVAGELLSLCGLEKEQITLLKPDPGQEGPLKAWQEYQAAARKVPAVLESFYTPAADPAGGMDLALDILHWLKERPELTPTLPASILSFLESEEESSTAFYIGRLPELDLLLSLTMDEPVVFNLFKQAARLFEEKNIAVRCAATKKELYQIKAERVIAFDPQIVSSIPEGTSFTTINELAGLKAESEEEPFSFRIHATRRKQLLERHTRVCVPDYAAPEYFLQYALLKRRGAWQLAPLYKPTLLFASKLPEEQSRTQRRQGAVLRVQNHPILPTPACLEFEFTFNNAKLSAREGEVISSALYAAGITVFGHHHKDGAAQGIYCVNGQCSQCMVLADGKPVKACMTPAKPGMNVQSVEGAPVLSNDSLPPLELSGPEELTVDLLIIGGGPAGICAAIELGAVGMEVLIVDDKQELGGKLSLQTHNFFGSVTDCYAGTRGVHIGRILADQLLKLPTVKVWLNATVVGVFSDGKFGVSRKGSYQLVKPKRVLFSTGAREKSLSFPGCDLPGVYGAGAFQTLVNRDLIRCAQRLFIIGGGNVGLIGAYHALQADIDVIGLVEALPRCGGYKVHEDKIKRLGVPVWTAHTVLRAEGREQVERVVVAAVDEKFKPVPGTERSFDVDTVLIAVGLSPVDELLKKARAYGMQVYAAGDAEEIAEASAAIFSGKITGRKIAQDSGVDLPIPSNWEAFGELLKYRPNEAQPFDPPKMDAPVYPLIRCMQEIPCNPCTEVCPKNCITMPQSILSLPQFAGECIGCGRCVLACPGLAITVVVNDYDPDRKMALLMLPFEFTDDLIPLGQKVNTTDMEGIVVGAGEVKAYKDRENQDKRRLLLLEVPYEDRLKVAGFRIRDVEEGSPLTASVSEEADGIICRCERVRKSEIVYAIRAGVRDMNQLKALVRAGLGSCNGKTCTEMILRIYREEGVPLSEIVMPTHRPLVAEVHLGDFIANENEENR